MQVSAQQLGVLFGFVFLMKVDSCLQLQIFISSPPPVWSVTIVARIAKRVTGGSRSRRRHKPPALTPTEGQLARLQGHDQSDGTSSPFENKVTISTFGSIMRITSTSALGSSSKIRKLSTVDYKPSKSLCKLSQLSTPPIPEEADQEGKSSPATLTRERRHRGNKKSRHGPGRPRGSKNQERRENAHHHHHHDNTPPPHPVFTPSLYPSSSSITQPSFSTTTTTTTTLSSSSHSSSSTSSFSTSRGSSLLGSGIYSSLKNPLCSTSASLGGGVCSASLSTGVLPSHALSLPPANTVTNPQVLTGYSSVTSSQPFTSGLSTLPPLLSQAPTSLPESELDDCHFPCQGNSPRESLSSQSPMSSLPLLFDQRDGLGAGVRACPENIPQSSSHIELLLEKHGNGEMGVNIVEMLQSLHSLQQENQRLQDQILSLTAKRERMQLLNTELAVPFPHGLSVQASLHAASQVNFLSSSPDPLITSNSALSKTCFLNDTSFVTSSEDLHSGSPSRSSSSLSFQSTPPPQQSPASLSQPVLNGRASSDGLGTISQAGSSTQPLAGGLLASLVGSPQLSMTGALSLLNGVIQSAVQSASQCTLPALRPQPPPLHPQSAAQSFQLPKSASPSSLLSEQQKQLLVEQQQQLQHFLTSQNFTPEQRAVVCQMLQQQKHRELQRLTLAGALTSAPSSPNLLSSVAASPLQGSQGGNLFGLQEGALHKPAAGEKSGDKNG